MSAAEVAAFFDVDHTLIEVNSGRKWVEYLWRQGEISIPEAMRTMWWLAKYKMSVLDYEAVTAHVTESYAGRLVTELREEVEAWFEADIKPQICTQARTAVEEHRRAGHRLVMLTSGPSFSTQPLLRELEMDHLLCTRVEERDGKLTGKHFRPSCYGEGKIVQARELAEREGIDFDASYFYTDSFTDRPMLDLVGHPRVVNPDPRLRAYALEQGWGYERWNAPA